MDGVLVGASHFLNGGIMGIGWSKLKHFNCAEWREVVHSLGLSKKHLPRCGWLGDLWFGEWVNERMSEWWIVMEISVTCLTPWGVNLIRWASDHVTWDWVIWYRVFGIPEVQINLMHHAILKINFENYYKNERKPKALRIPIERHLIIHLKT